MLHPDARAAGLSTASFNTVYPHHPGDGAWRRRAQGEQGVAGQICGQVLLQVQKSNVIKQTSLDFIGNKLVKVVLVYFLLNINLYGKTLTA